MADLLNTGISALLSYRKALDTTGHNIANVNTPGYSRQRVELVSRLGGPSGDGYVGSGVQAATVRRVTDSFVGARVMSDTATHARTEQFETVASQIDTWLSDAATGLGPPLNQLFDGLNDLAANPTSDAVRQTLLGDARGLATRFRSLQNQLDGVQVEINGRLRQSVEDINGAAQFIAGLNLRIGQASAAAGGQPPNDLLDQRDAALQQLSALVGISTTVGDDGAVNVFTGSGQALVLGAQAQRLAVADDAYGSGQLDITFGGGVVTAQLGGGAIGGLLDAQRELLDPVRAQLGRLAIGLTEAFNNQHQLGVDAFGDGGELFFNRIGGTALAAGGNSGNAEVIVGFDDVGALTGGAYELRFDGANWQLRDLGTGAGVPMAGSGSAGDPFVAAGLSLVVSGTPGGQDRFRIEPTREAAGQVQLAISDPGRIAAAGAGAGADSSDNTNARALLGLQDQGLLDGGRNSLPAAHEALVAGIGNQARQAGVARDAQQALLSQSLAARDAASGVNLDEEASDLVRFQQAYQAAAQVIAVADTVFQSLLSAVRR